MEYKLFFILLVWSHLMFAQKDFPFFLQGTWKVENKDAYEHWDKLNDETFKGFSYKKSDGRMIISEYSEIKRKASRIVYTATVLSQNQGKGIDFQMTRSDSVFTFENLSHDFPKKISYTKITNDILHVEISGSNEKRYRYRLDRVVLDITEKDSSISNPNYDKTLAENLKADDYGMKGYVFVILKTGSNQTKDKELISKCFRGHLDNITRLVDDKKLIVAGPFNKNDKNYRGIFILTNVESLKEASELLQTDPAIKEGLLDVELFDWYGSAALPEYLPVSDKIWKVKP